MEETVREYRMEDELLRTRAQTQHDALVANLAAFTARFPWIVAAYTASYQTDIDTAESFTEDDTVVADITVLTADVNASVLEGKTNLGILFLYAEITYPKDKVKQRVFGQDLVAKARQDQEKMKSVLEHAYSFANKSPFKTDLLGKGYTQIEIDALLTVADNIGDKNRLQENAKNNRPLTTQDRIIVHNTLFDRMRIIYKCAQVVFAGNAAMIGLFRVNPPQTSGAVTTAQVHLTNIETGDNLGGLTVAVVDTDLTLTSDDGGIVNFDLGASPGESIAFTVSGADIATQTFEGLAIIEGEDNVFEIQVVVG